VGALMAVVVQPEGEGTRLDAVALRTLPPGLSRRVVRGALRGLKVSGTSNEVERVLAVASGEAGAAEVSGFRVEPSGSFVVLVKRRVEAAPAEPFRLTLDIPGMAEWEAGRWAVEALGPTPRQQVSVGSGATDQVAIAADVLLTPLVVRRREPGDRIRPFGLGGSKKLQDILVDRKIEASQRDLVPVVTDARGRLIWVAGHVLAEDFRVTSDTNAVVILKLRRIQRSGSRVARPDT
jgi:tRNA(Ile)-lysidine synthase